jgi:hypothetical protein
MAWIWEVMNVCVIMHNMIIESECVAPVNDNHPYDFQDPLAKVDHELSAEFGLFPPCITKSVMKGFVDNLKIICWSIYVRGGDRRMCLDLFKLHIF